MARAAGSAPLDAVAVSVLVTVLALPASILGNEAALRYAFTVPADSGALTSGMSAAAEPRFRGATLALHSTVGFGLSAFGGWAVGAAIDAAGGAASASGWLAAFAVMGAGILFGPMALWWSRRGQ